MHRWCAVVWLCLWLFNATAQGQEPVESTAPLLWKPLPNLPDKEGFAGMFAGVTGGKLWAAGGANFPMGYPWEGGSKKWYDEVWSLDSIQGEWKKEDLRLPRPLAYGVSASWGPWWVLAGGETEPAKAGELPYMRSEVWGVRWDGKQAEIKSFPSLPLPAAHACGAMLGSKWYVAGGVESNEATKALGTFWMLDLAQPVEQMQWQALPTWPGPPRMQATAGVQGGKFYLFGGLELKAAVDGKPERAEPYLRDAYAYSPTGAGSWQKLADMPVQRVAAPSPALTSGASHLVLFGGCDAAQQHLDRPTHAGWSHDALIYHTVTDTWVLQPHAIAESAPRVTVPTVVWQGQTVMVSGERSPGKRSPAVWGLQTVPAKADFGWLNYAALILYLSSMLLVGVYFSRNNQTTDDFFRGGQHMPWWAAGLSIFATMLSSITFMAVPAAAFVDGWRNFLANSYLLITPLVVWVYLPFYRQLNVTSAYEYLERRFNLAARWIGSGLFMLFQAGRIAVVLYLPSLALATVTDLNITVCMVLMGVISIVYSMMGGIQAVIWTDVIQTFVLVGGGLLALAVMVGQVDGGWGEMVSIVQRQDRFFGSVEWSWDMTVASGWVIVVGSMFSNMLPYTASQDVVQRYVTTPDEPTAARAIWLNAAFALPANMLFFVIGSGLLAFYTLHPGRLDPTMPNDAVFPLFIVRELPAGVAGIVIAGLFAAAQSTISSSLNSISTCLVTDFLRRLRPDLSDAHYLNVARWSTVVVGLLGTGLALVLATWNIKTMYDIFLEILALFGGTLAGIFALGIFTRRATGPGALVGIVASAALVLLLKFTLSLTFFSYAPLGLSTCMMVGYFSSFVLPSAPKDLTNLTIYTKA